MAIVFPASPSVNDTFTAGSITYKWDGAKWIGLGVTPADRLVEGSNKLEIDGSNNLVWTGGSASFGGGAAVIASSGNLSIDRTTGTNDILNGKLNGTVTSTLNANGLIELGSASNSTNNNGLYLGGNNGSLNLYTTRYSTDCFQILNTSGSGTNVALRAYGNGDLEIAGKTVIGSYTQGSEQLRVKGAEADIWLDSQTSGIWRILGSTGGSTHRFRIYDNTNSRDVFEVYASGAVRKPANPAFCVRQSVSSNGFFANSKATWDTVDINIGSFFDTTNHRFVCPVDGIYYFSCQILSMNGARLFTHLRRNEVAQSVPGSYTETYDPSTNTYQTATISMLLTCSATESISVWLGSQNGYGSNYSNFSGYLVS